MTELRIWEGSNFSKDFISFFIAAVSSDIELGLTNIPDSGVIISLGPPQSVATTGNPQVPRLHPTHRDTCQP